MKKFYFIVLFLLVLSSIVYGQEVYKELISSERERRGIYKLSDWIGYYNMRHIRSITTDNKYIYFATEGGGIWRYNKIQEEWTYPFTVCNGLPDNDVFFVYYDRTQNVLIAYTRTDTAVFDYGQQIWLSKSQEPFLPYKVNIVPEKPKGQKGINYFYAGYHEEFGALAFTNPGYFYLLGGKLQDPNLEEYRITGYFIDDYNHIFITIEGIGVAIGTIQDSYFTIMEGGLSDISPRAFYFTPNEIWIGGIKNNKWFGGIVKWDNTNVFKIYKAEYNPDIDDDNVTFITGNDSLLFLGTINGLVKYQPKIEKWTSYTQADGLIHQHITSLFLEDSILWIGTERGLSVYYLKENKIIRWADSTLRNQYIYDFFADEKKIYMATSLGLFSKNLRQKEWKPFPIGAPFPQVQITTVAADENELWVAGAYGIGMYDKQARKWKFFRELTQKVSPPYYDIVFYEYGVFIGTDNGLLRYDKRTDKWQWYTNQDGLMNNTIYQLYVENGYIWMVTPDGICQFHYKNVIH